MKITTIAKERKNKKTGYVIKNFFSGIVNELTNPTEAK